MTAPPDFPFGARLRREGGVAFGLWAPGCASVELQLEGAAGDRRAMLRTADGWHTLTVADAAAGTRYGFVASGGLAVPDPASRFNADDVHGPSEVVDPLAYTWRNAAWPGRPWHEAVIYELHVGTFTPEGTFAAATERLHALAELGITAVELLPVADFPGRRSWGYDGVLLFAPDAAYGTPAQLKALVDTAHGLGMMVLLDVVYNHFGPEGNYLHAYCPQFFNPAHQTPWGAAINFDGQQNAPVRAFYVHNALYWVEEFRFDGLRLDAVHAIRDDSPRHIVAEIASALQGGPGQSRHVHLVLENERNEAHRLQRDERGAPRQATAQWNDDFHHAAHVLLTGETEGYYADYAEAPAELLARALTEGFVYQGQASVLRGGAPHGEPSVQLPPTAFVSFLQNHDQIGNRAFGQRLSDLGDADRLDALYACLLLSPHVPMLFQGEEFAASAPFLFFCDFGAELAQAVATGRRAEFARFAAFRDEAAREQIADPNAPATFAASKLRWEERGDGAHARRLALVRELLAARQRHLVPRLAGFRTAGSHRVEGGVIHADWRLAGGAGWQMRANLGITPAACEALPAGQTVYASRPLAAAGAQARILAPATVIVTLIDG